MSLHFLAALAGALIAAGGCGMLAARSLRTPNSALIAWTVALAGLTVSLGAQALGYDIGFWGAAFRVMAIGALVVAPLGLALGLAEITAKSLAARFAARLILSALGFVAVVILGTDPLSAATFTKVWPSPTTYYQLIPKALLQQVLPPVTVLVVVIGVAAAAVRQGRDPAWRDAFLPAAAAGAAALLLSLPGLADLAKVSLPLATGFVLLCIVAVAATWFAGAQGSSLQLGVLRGTADSSGGGILAKPGLLGEPGDFDPDDEFGIYRRNGSGARDRASGFGDGGYPARVDYPDESGMRDRGGFPDPDGIPGDGGQAGDPRYMDQPGFGDRGGYPDEEYQGGPGHPGDPRYADDAGYADQAGYRDAAGHPDAAGYPDQAGYAQQAGYPDETGYRDSGGYAAPEPGYEDSGGYAAPEPGYRNSGRYAGPDPGDPAAGRHRDRAGYPDGGPATEDGEAQLFGQIAIYTLLEDRVDDFDRLTRAVVRQVREQEPDTLVYIVHAVPAAPMQRILYEVYRDRAAYQEHKRQPYVVAFEADRRPFVLATNVIELGLQQAKVSPLPSVADLLSDTGFDLLSDSGYGQPGYGPRR